MSKIKVNEIEAQSGSTITVPTGQNLVVTDGLGTASLPTIPTSKGGTGLTSLGTANQVIAVNSGATALEFQTASSGGVVQFKNTIKTDGFGTSSSSPTDVTGLSVNITPSSTSNKILVMCNANLSADSQSGGLLYLKVVRVIGSTTTQLNESTSSDTYIHAHVEVEANANTSHVDTKPYNILILDNPQTTSQCTYKLQAFTNGSNTAIIGRSGRSPSNVNDVQHATNIMVMELDGGIL